MAAGSIVGAGSAQDLARRTGCDSLEDSFVALAYGQPAQTMGEPA
jgi:sodium transport system ATP-binding protein